MYNIKNHHTSCHRHPRATVTKGRASTRHQKGNTLSHAPPRFSHAPARAYTRPNTHPHAPEASTNFSRACTRRVLTRVGLTRLTGSIDPVYPPDRSVDRSGPFTGLTR